MEEHDEQSEIEEPAQPTLTIAQPQQVSMRLEGVLPLVKILTPNEILSFQEDMQRIVDKWFRLKYGK